MSLTEKVTVLKSSQALGSVERVGHAHLPVHHMELQGEPDLNYVNESPACQ